MKRRILVVVIALLAVLPLAQVTPTLAQPPGQGQGKGPGPKEGRGPQRARQRLQKLRNKLLHERLGLDEATAAKVEAVLRDHVAQQRQAQRGLRAAKADLSRLLRADSDDQAAYEAAISKLMTAHRKLEKLRETHYEQLAELLTPKQRAQLIQTLHRVRRHLTRAKRQGQRRQGPRRPRLPRPPVGPRR